VRRSCCFKGFLRSCVVKGFLRSCFVKGFLRSCFFKGLLRAGFFKGGRRSSVVKWVLRFCVGQGKGCRKRGGDEGGDDKGGREVRVVKGKIGDFVGPDGVDGLCRSIKAVVVAGSGVGGSGVVIIEFIGVKGLVGAPLDQEVGVLKEGLVINFWRAAQGAEWQCR
jgi:hypothetical protein